MVDVLHENWDDGIPSDWEDINSHCNQQKTTSVSFAIPKLNRQFIDKSNIVVEEDVLIDCNTDFRKCTVNGKIIVSKMSLSLFQRCLVNHFDMRFKQNTVVWPKHIRKLQTI